MTYLGTFKKVYKFATALRILVRLPSLFYGVMVTRQILVLKFKVRVLVEQL